LPLELEQSILCNQGDESWCGCRKNQTENSYKWIRRDEA
jgi:hypothetical protein